MASLAWPVCYLILSVETPACTALVAKPARRLWPEKPAGSMLGGGDALLEDERHGLTRKPLGGDTAMPVDGPENGAGFDPGNRKPAVKREDGAVTGSAEGDADLTPRAFLIGLRAPERDDDPLPDALDVAAIEAHDFRPPEPAREAEQEQRPIPRVLHALAHGVQDPEQVIMQQRLGLSLSDPARALDAPQGGADDFRPAGVGQPSRLVRLRDGRDAADEGGDGERLRVGGQVGGHERRLGGQRAAPGREMGEVGPVGPACVVSDARLDQGGDLVGNRVRRAFVQSTARDEMLSGGVWSSTGPSPPSLERQSGSSGGPFVSRDKWGLSRVRMMPSTPSGPEVSVWSGFMGRPFRRRR